MSNYKLTLVRQWESIREAYTDADTDTCFLYWRIAAALSIAKSFSVYKILSRVLLRHCATQYAISQWGELGERKQNKKTDVYVLETKKKEASSQMDASMKWVFPIATRATKRWQHSPKTRLFCQGRKTAGTSGQLPLSRGNILLNVVWISLTQTNWRYGHRGTSHIAFMNNTTNKLAISYEITVLLDLRHCSVRSLWKSYVCTAYLQKGRFIVLSVVLHLVLL